MYSTLHFCADMQRLQALAFITKTKKNIVVVFVFYERKTDNVMRIAVWQKVLISAKIKHPVHDRFMNTDFNFCLHGFQNISKIQLWFLIISRRKSFLLYL